MGEVAKLLLAWLGNPKRALVTVAIGAATFSVLVWQFPQFAAAMKDPIQRWSTVALILSASGLATYPIEHLAKASFGRRKIIKRLHSLAIDEKVVLQRYLRDQITVATWGRIGGAAEMLRRDGILVAIAMDVEKAGTVTMDSFAINPTAWKYLHCHPELIDLEPLPKR